MVQALNTMVKQKTEKWVRTIQGRLLTAPMIPMMPVKRKNMGSVKTSLMKGISPPEILKSPARTIRTVS